MILVSSSFLRPAVNLNIFAGTTSFWYLRRLMKVLTISKYEVGVV